VREEGIVPKPRRASIVDKSVGLGKTGESSLELHEEFMNEVERILKDETCT